MSNEDPLTIGEFVELILQTEIAEAKDWLDGLIKVVPGWSAHCLISATSESVEHLAFSISGQICQQLKELRYVQNKDWRELAKKGHTFLQEIHQKATDIGLKVSLQKIDWILEPDMARSSPTEK